MIKLLINNICADLYIQNHPDKYKDYRSTPNLVLKNIILTFINNRLTYITACANNDIPGIIHRMQFSDIPNKLQINTSVEEISKIPAIYIEIGYIEFSITKCYTGAWRMTKKYESDYPNL